MSAPAEQAVDADPAGPTAADATVTGASGRTLWRRYRWVPVALGAVLLVALVIGVAQTRSVGGQLDPRAADETGSRALATLLGERGVAVSRTTDPAGLAAGTDDRTILLVPFPEVLTDQALRPIRDLDDGTVVLVGPAADTLDQVTDEVEFARTTDVGSREPNCAEPAAVAAGAATMGGDLYRVDDGAGCYAGPDDGEDAGAPLVAANTRGGARLVVLGTGDPLTNGALADGGNAALALNLLGADGSADEVRWLVPAPGSAAGEDGGTLSSILPAWVLPAGLQLLLAGLLLALWRGRRLGPPVAEPLPVVVRAAEAVEGRARLYRRAQARDRAADALRSGALARLVPRLGLGAGAGGEPAPESVVAAVAGRTGRPDAEVHATLYGPPPADDAGLVRLSETLDSMVRSTLDPEVPHP